MRKFLIAALALLLCISLTACFLNPFHWFKPEEGVPETPEAPVPTGDSPTVGFQWIITPQYMFSDIQAINVYSEAGMSGAHYLVFKDGDAFGLLDSSLNIVVEAICPQVPIICPMNELHLLDQDYATVTDMPLPADLHIAQGEHGVSTIEYIFDYTTNEIYLLEEYEYVPLSEHGTAGLPEIFPVQYAVMTSDGPFGLAPDYRGDYDYCDRSGKLVTRENFEYADIFCNGFAAVQKGGKYSYLNEELTLITDYQFLPSHGEVYVNKTNSVIAPALSYRFLAGYAVVRAQSGYGVINEQGELVVPCKYQKMVPMLGGEFAVKENNQWGVAVMG